MHTYRLRLKGHPHAIILRMLCYHNLSIRLETLGEFRKEGQLFWSHPFHHLIVRHVEHVGGLQNVVLIDLSGLALHKLFELCAECLLAGELVGEDLRVELLHCVLQDVKVLVDLNSLRSALPYNVSEVVRVVPKFDHSLSLEDKVRLNIWCLRLRWATSETLIHFIISN